MSSIRKRTWPSGRQIRTAWQCDYVDQQGKRRARQFPTRKAATAFLNQAVYEVKRGIHSPVSTSITVAEAVRNWLEHSEAEGLERGTLRAYRIIAATHIVPILGTVKLAALSQPIVEKYRDDLLNGAVPDGRKRSRGMARKAIATVKAVLKEANWPWILR